MKNLQSSATAAQIRQMLNSRSCRATNILIITSIEEGFQLALADITPAFASIKVDSASPLYARLRRSFGYLLVKERDTDVQNWKELIFKLSYTNSLALSLDLYVSHFSAEELAELEIRLINSIDEQL